ncbi:MAG: hypothetical protein EBR86_06120 [Planctomycetia bacterium]|nr:hypothetical protein [Planctomycetia bacterium]
MQIVIPMSGFGERFRRAGYRVPKPLIVVEGKPIVAHVVDMFPGADKVVFVCNQEHLDDPGFRMRAILEEACPAGRVVGIAPHKLGPIHAVRQVEHLLDPDDPVVVNYCDFTCYWDWEHFQSFVAATSCDGAIPAYRGFHPHSLGNTNYAYMREAGGWVLDIQEKQPYTANRMEEFASSGTYFFRSARLMSMAFRATVEQDLQLGGEFYASLAYKPLLAMDLAIAVYPLQHFMQWGTPQDVAEYNYRSRAFRRLVEPVTHQSARRGTVIMPMAGLGQRFVNEGYTLTKPLIPVSGQPMVAQAIADLPPPERHVFVLRADMPGCAGIATELQRRYPGALIKTIDHVTDGQACTTLVGLDAVADDGAPVAEPIIVAACDNGALYDARALDELAVADDYDVIVFGARGYPNALRLPRMYGWIDARGGDVRAISVKEPLEHPESDPVVLGTFVFRTADILRRVVRRLVERDGRVNGEFYLDSCVNDAIAMGLRCRLFEVDSYVCWGTPDDLRTFEYWQSCFHKWAGHPYRLVLDGRVPGAAVPDLEERYRPVVPALPGKRP